jgi:hypothetical protein
MDRIAAPASLAATPPMDQTPLSLVPGHMAERRRGAIAVAGGVTPLGGAAGDRT